MARQKPEANGDDLLKPRDVATLLGVHYVTLSNWRASRAGPPFIKLGTGPRSPVRYRRSDIRAFLEGRVNQ